MPQSFKALSSTIAWTLFVLGWIVVLLAIGGGIALVTGLFVIPGVSWLTVVAIFGAGIISFVLSACAIKLRQLVE